MTQNKILTVLGQQDSDLPGNRVTGFDWHEHGVQTPFIIFFTGRCGSTWLTRLLEDSGLCGYPHELFNESTMPRFNGTINAGNFRDYFSGAVSSFSRGGRFGFKIDEYRLRELQPLIDFGSVFPKEITRFFWMTRRDMLDQAFSYARAKATGHWHDFTTKPRTEVTGEVELSDTQMWREILEVAARERRMARFFENEGIDPIRLDYEQMTADRLLTVMKVMLDLGCSPDEVEPFLERMEDKTLKLELGNKYRLLGSFYSKYQGLLRQMEEQRLSVDLEGIKEELRTSFDLHL